MTEVRDVQFRKESLPIVSSVDGKLMLDSFEQVLKAELLIAVMPSGSLTVVNAVQPWKQLDGSDTIDEGISTLVSDVQLENAENPSFVTLVVSSTVFRLVQSLKPFAPTGALTQMLVSDEQAPKAWLPIAVTDDGIVT